jgi:hypothetical protein
MTVVIAAHEAALEPAGARTAAADTRRRAGLRWWMTLCGVGAVALPTANGPVHLVGGLGFSFAVPLDDPETTAVAAAARGATPAGAASGPASPDRPLALTAGATR